MAASSSSTAPSSSACSPRDCAAASAECGSVPDGCGHVLDCGPCSGWLQCGALHANQCGATCAQACPAEFSCNGQGVCAGCPAGALELDSRVPPLVEVTGTLRLNGAPLQLFPGATDGTVGIWFASLDGYGTQYTSTSAQQGWQYQVWVYAGRYRVSVAERQGTDACALSSTQVTAAPDVAFTQAVNPYDVDVLMPELVTVTGRLRVNGGSTILAPGQDAGAVYVILTNLDGLENTGWWVDSSHDWQFQAQVYASHYRVSVSVNPYDNRTVLPSHEPVLVQADVHFTGSTAWDVDVPLPPLTTVSGRLTINGATPVLAPGAAAGQVYVQFLALDGPASSSLWVRSAENWQYSTPLFAGRYRVQVLADSNGNTTSVPVHPLEVLAAVDLAAPAQTLDLDVHVPPWTTVTGKLLADGTPDLLAPGYSDGKIYVQFVNRDGLDGVGVWAWASQGWQYAVTLYAGHYQVSVGADLYENHTQLPVTHFTTVYPDILVGAPAQALDLDIHLPRVLVSGVLRVNGGSPPLWAGQTDGQALVHFVNLDDLAITQAQTSFNGGWQYRVALYPGTYRVEVSEGFGQDHSLLTQAFVVAFPARDLRASQVLDVDVTIPPLEHVEGTLSMNGAPVALVPGQTSADVVVWFYNLDGLDNAVATAAVGQGGRFQVDLYPGLYKITARSQDNRSLFPTHETTLAERILLGCP